MLHIYIYIYGMCINNYTYIYICMYIYICIICVCAHVVLNIICIHGFFNTYIPVSTFKTAWAPNDCECLTPEWSCRRHSYRPLSSSPSLSLSYIQYIYIYIIIIIIIITIIIKYDINIHVYVYIVFGETTGGVCFFRFQGEELIPTRCI